MYLYSLSSIEFSFRPLPKIQGITLLPPKKLPAPPCPLFSVSDLPNPVIPRSIKPKFLKNVKTIFS